MLLSSETKKAISYNNKKKPKFKNKMSCYSIK